MPSPAPRQLRRRSQGTCALLLIIGAWAVAGASCSAAGEPPTLRVMTYNIAAGNGNLAGIADVIREADPDIVALQEVDVHWGERSGYVDQAAWLAETLGMQVRFGPIYQLPGVPLREFGLAILTREPIVGFTNHEIPRLSTQAAEPEPRALPGFLEAVVDVGGMRVHVFDTHLDYRADPRVREQQAAAMLEVMRDLDGPVILMGDLNATADARELEPLFVRFQDAWHAGHGDGFTYPAVSPERRIDYVLFSDAFHAAWVRVQETAASDHRPVIADLVAGGPGTRSAERRVRP
jgi:endonuclease/exonuclease/phosphatase family metal-dependent hydrolase